MHAYWSAKHVLVETAKLIGYGKTNTLDPGNLDPTGVKREACSVWLRHIENEFLSAGYNFTKDEDQMNVYKG